MKNALVLLIICATLGCSEQPSATIGVCSDLFRDVPFTDLEGREARLPCQGHKVLVVNFWAT
jgi:hypothetical protein